MNAWLQHLSIRGRQKACSLRGQRSRIRSDSVTWSFRLRCSTAQLRTFLMMKDGSPEVGPRIRSIKPEISRSPDFTKLSNTGRVAFYALIGQADDEGRLQGFDAQHLAATYCAPGTSSAEVAEQLDLMESLRMIRRYGGRSGVLYTSLLQWSAHQRIDKPKTSAIPPPPLSKRRGLVGDRSATRLTGSDQTGEDQIRPERIRPEPPKGSPATDGGVLVLTPPVSLSPVEQVFEAWRLRWHPTAKLTPERKAKISARLLERWSVEDLVLAVTVGAERDPWAERHVGLNDDIKNLVRNGSTVEKFLELANGPVGVHTSATRQGDRLRGMAETLRGVGQ